MDELSISSSYARGSTGPVVRHIQEWLALHDFGVGIDGSFGPATESAVRQFQEDNGLPVTGIVDPETYDRLVQPMKDAIRLPEVTGLTLGAAVVVCAEQHVDQHPREVGGQNCGPWVRRYMAGAEGEQSPWCAGFACCVLNQACRALDVPLPLPLSNSSSTLAAGARQNGIFRSGADVTGPADVPPGSLFLVRGGATGWRHTGIVVKAEAEILRTIEGNTNDEGSAEGYEACRRTRSYLDKDFIIV